MRSEIGQNRPQGPSGAAQDSSDKWALEGSWAAYRSAWRPILANFRPHPGPLPRTRLQMP